MRNLKTLLQTPLIGLKAKILSSTNHCNVGIAGTIVDETKNTLTIMEGSKKKLVLKKGTTLQITLEDGTVVRLEGNSVLGRPEDRIKRRIKRWW